MRIDSLEGARITRIRRDIEGNAQRQIRHSERGDNVVKMAKPFEFIQEVRQEVAKVTWPTRKETTVTAIAVFVMVVMAMLFFFSVDWILGHTVSLVLSLV